MLMDARRGEAMQVTPRIDVHHTHRFPLRWTCGWLWFVSVLVLS